MHVIPFVGKSWHGQIQDTVGSLWGKKIGDSALGGGIEPGQGWKEMWSPVGIWEPLLRFIGVGILQTWGIIHGKASLSGPVYKMRQGWQRWRPSTTGPSCLNMGLSHLTHPWHQLQPFSISLKNTHRRAKDWQSTTAGTSVSFYHRTGSMFAGKCTFFSFPKHKHDFSF